jgi:hypothetical protein
MVFLACLALLVLAFAHGLITRPDESLLARYGSAYGIVLKSSFAGVWLGLLGLRAMEAARGRFLRRMMAESGVSKEDVEAVLPVEAGPPWWRVELSGFHLVMWLGLPVLVYLWRTAEDVPDWMMAILAWLLLGWVCKGFFLLQFLTASPDHKPLCSRQYRWLGTLRGTLFMLVGLPAIILAVVWLLFWLLDLVGW